MTTDDKGLLNCPFCGGEASPDGVIRYSDSHVREQEWGQNEFYYCNCVRCGVSNRGLIGYRSQTEAIAAWNRRHSPVLSAEDAALVERLDATQAVEILERNIVAGDIDDDTAVFIVAGLIGELMQLAPAPRLEALSRREQWQDISTAPKEPLTDHTQEGPAILLYGGFGGGHVRVGHWKAARTNNWCDATLGRMPRQPTHWMPLPLPPAQDTGGSDA